ncbi:MAG: aminoacyl-histidine dipeptidase [Acutalibacteraceae bacterium]|nr:aminoacyl-histidine dipeptidase [Acutalibacteraceae bacterium]
MSVLYGLKPSTVFSYFEEICSIPHGSGNVGKIADYCVKFAQEHNLRYVRDNADNIIIYKDGNNGSTAPIILQGHLDMVCQKTDDSKINFETDGLDIYVDGDLITAQGTTLGADNGIALAMILSILASNSLKHPPIEAVFTSDEEVGMIGAGKLDASLLTSKRMINLDSEEENTVTVSCAGGSDFAIRLPFVREPKQGIAVKVELKGLRGGHSGVEIHKGRVNANILLGRVLDALTVKTDFDIISVNGGDKANAITNHSTAELLVYDFEEFNNSITDITSVIKNEISAREPDFYISVSSDRLPAEVGVFDTETLLDVIYILGTAPNGVMEMSAEIKGLVETSLNLGILKTNSDHIYIHFALRSNKMSALAHLEDKLTLFFSKVCGSIETSGHYPSWEYKPVSSLRDTYIRVYTDVFGKAPNIEAIHAGLECGVFASKIEGIDCIAIGPQMYDVHTTGESLVISSAERIYNVLVKTLENL